VFEECWEFAVFVEDFEDTCVDEEGNGETFGVLEFIPLTEIEHGGRCSHDKK
jgi:hypothetical protein